ncbi:hypothetical protein PUR23_29760 [Methylorubrum populi]|uniref:hypothetical protein n=1 Tax=Methylorubrum populi TaxID=223967 RepID=UPI0031F8F680
MTQQAAAILKRARERASAAREQHAAERMNWKAATDAISAAAARGEAEVAIAGPEGVNLQDAPTAAETTRKLAAGGFAVDWIERPPMRPGDPKIWSLLIRW